MMKINNAFQDPCKFELRANGDKPVLEMIFSKRENHALMFNILQAMGFSIETNEGIKNRFWFDLPERYLVSLSSWSCIGVLQLWHNDTYLEITSEHNMRITGKEEIMEKVANLCLHSNPPLACSVQSGV